MRMPLFVFVRNNRFYNACKLKKTVLQFDNNYRQNKFAFVKLITDNGIFWFKKYTGIRYWFLTLLRHCAMANSDNALL